MGAAWGCSPVRVWRYKLQFQQPDLQGQRFLDVGVQPALELLDDAQILHRRLRRDPLRHALGARQLRKHQERLRRVDSG